MYYKANDNELIYLIKEGSNAAYRTLYIKYEHLLHKIYIESMKSKGIVMSDFKQEGLMCLEQAIHTYQEKYNCSFYSYFMTILHRNILKLSRKNGLSLRENVTEYKDEDFFVSKLSKSSLIHIVIRDLKLDASLDKDIFYECILHNTKITVLARKYNMDYSSVYMKYKKIKQKVEKILTNLKV
ncbi:MAG: hypothetical protein K2H06_05000 [Anaeroplasmataceae bacterium]|nr:hypothetical protein [Anaeroplasmataceae bacterium]